MLRFKSLAVLLTLLLGLLPLGSGNTCTKEQIHTYMNNDPSFPQRFRVQFKKSIVVTCCAGYREVSRNRIPVCKPICVDACVNGFCIAPNKCACNDGFRLPLEGVCIKDDTELAPPTTTVANRNTTTCLAGYEAKPDGKCQPICSQPCPNGQCIEPNHCKCLDGYAYDSESLQCKPLCNGKIYGCIRGICVGYNQCRCENGTALQKNELFHCIPAESTESPVFDYRWLLLLLLVPLLLVVCVSCHIIVRRWKLAKARRLEAQAEDLPEVRYYNPSNDHSLSGKHRRAKGEVDQQEPIYSNSTLHRRGGEEVAVYAI